MKRLILLVFLLLSILIPAKVVFDPDKVDPKLVKQIEADMDARKLTTPTTWRLTRKGPDTFEVVRILKTQGEKNSYHGVVEPIGNARDKVGGENYVR